MKLETPLTRHAGIEVPLICGAMYPCSNVELVAAASEAGAIGIVQPVTLTFVHGIEFRDGLRRVRALTKKPIGPGDEELVLNPRSRSARLRAIQKLA